MSRYDPVWFAQYYAKNAEKLRARAEAYRKAHPVAHAMRARRYRLKLRLEVLKHYGKRCACCGEERLEFLCVDHVMGGGSKERRETGRTGVSFYMWLRTHKYPKGYRVLCHNCNMALGLYGRCPHQGGDSSA